MICILTLKIEETAQRYFDALRKQYFPPERNFLSAHITLFHQLPLVELPQIKSLNLLAASVVSIGNGVAIKIECDELIDLHKQMQQRWAAHLIPQDRQKLWPHITIQNKVSPETAKQTLAELELSFTPFYFEASGLQLWEYLGGPWRLVEPV
jgi:hypothetical protein